MAEAEVPQHKVLDPINIEVLRIRNLAGHLHKGTTIHALVKLEFGEKTLGESQFEFASEECIEVNYTASLSCLYDDPVVLDELSYKPLVLTLVEVLPKEKKQKEVKTFVLGQVSIDLLPLVTGETKHNYTLEINPTPGSSLEQIDAEEPKPEVDICLSVKTPLLDKQQMQESNLMTVMLESCFSPPDVWSMNLASHVYSVALPVPVSSEKDMPVVFGNGGLKLPDDKEATGKQRKWVSPGTAVANAIYIPNSFISECAPEDEDGDLRSKEDREHRNAVELEKNRVVWNMERRCYMEPSGVKSLQYQITKCRYWPVEIFRIPLPSAAKAKKEDEQNIGFHGIAYVNLAPLLYPGVKRVRGAYKVHAFTEKDLQDKTKRSGSICEEASRIAMLLSRITTSPFPKKGGKETEKPAKDKDVKKGVSQQIKSSETGSEMEGGPVVNVEGQMYVDAKSYVTLEITLTKPLIPKRPPEELARRVAEYIPPRPVYPKRTNGAQRAIADFHDQVASVSNLILDEFRCHFGDELKDNKAQSPDEMEKRRQRLLYELNSSGKYFAFKEQLKHSVVKIVREKYLKTASFDDRDELQSFLSELYVYLIDQMHCSLGRVLAVEDQAPVPEPLTDSSQLKHFAREAEVNENFELAIKYYQERIARDRNDASHWFDYGTFCMYVNDITKAEECFKECVSIDQRHANGLLMYGVVCAVSERNDVAETFFEAATCVNPKSITAWTMLGLFYDSTSNEIGAEMAFLEANKLNQAEAMVTARAVREQLEREKVVTEHTEEDDTAFQQSPEANNVEAESDPDVVAVENAPDIKQTHATPDSTSAKSRPSQGKLDKLMSAKKGSGSAAVGQKQLGGQSTMAVSRPASSKFAIPVTSSQSIDEPQEIPFREPTPIPMASVFMQTVDWLLDVKVISFTERCLAHELLDPHGGESCLYNIAMARLDLQKQKFEQAESCLKQALQLDVQNVDGWALMGHVQYMLGQMDSARDCYERTLTFVSNTSEAHAVMLRLASIYLQEGRFTDSKRTFLLACKRSPSSVSWLGVGISCYRMDELSEAEDALSEANILNNLDPEVWAYLSLVCLKTDRQLEAEQAYKYSVKLNLQDHELMAEVQYLQQEVGFGNPQM